MSASDVHSVIVKQDGTVWVVGKNNYGQVGDNTTVTKKAWVCISDLKVKVPQTSITIHKVNGTYELKPILDVGFNLLYDSMDNGDYAYVSKNEQIATVNEKGIITGVKRGKTKIGITETNTEKTIYVDVYVLEEDDIAFPQIVTTQSSTIALKSDGTVWSWGQNNLGQLGLGDNDNRVAPTKVDISNIVKIAVSANHALALTTDGEVYAWGANTYGQLGQNNNNQSSLIPVKVKDSLGTGFLTNIKDITTANNMSMALDNKGNVYAWGLNDAGQLGDGTKTSRPLPIQVKVISNITKIEGGNKSSYAISDEGNVYAWGYNNYGQLGDGTNTLRVTPVKLAGVLGIIDISASATDQVLVLKNDETVWGWGYSTLGALTDVGGATPKQIAGLEGRIKDIASVNAGYYGGLAITNDAKVLAWGNNGFGGLGNGTTTNANVPAYVMETQDKELSSVFISEMGKNYSVFGRENGEVWAVGYNENGELGNTSTATISMPENISQDYISTDVLELTFNTLEETKKINAKYNFGFNLHNYDNSEDINYESEDTSIAVVDNGGNVTAKGIGKTYINITSGKLARRIEVNVLEKDEIAVMDIQAGLKHTVGIKTNGTIWSFGDNTYGQLGLGETANTEYGEPQEITTIPEGVKFTKISVGKNHTLVLDTNGFVYSFGSNSNGQLGLDISVGTGIGSNSARPVKIEGLSNIVKIVAYENRSMAVDKDGNLYVWGEGYSKNPEKVGFYTKVVDITGRLVLSEYGTVWNMTDLTQKIPGITNIVEIASGDSHNLALKADGKVYSWGNNAYGQLGTGNTTANNEPVAVHDILHPIESIKCGQYSSYLLTKNGEVYSFGRNTNNSLGQNTTDKHISTPTKIESTNVERISAGQNYGVYVTEKGFVYSWGLNSSGQLGHGDKADRGIPTLIGGAKIKTDRNVITLKEKDTHNLDITLENTFNLRKDLIASDGFTFKSINSNIASVQNGTITGESSGLTTVVVEHENSDKATNIYVEVLMQDAKSVIDIKSSKDFTIALKADGTIWSWGLNNNGQLALSNNSNSNEPVQIELETRVKQIAVGDAHTVVLTQEGKVLTSGLNTNGQLGNGTLTNTNTLGQIIDEFGKVVNNIAYITAKGNTTYLLDYDGNVYAFGDGYNKVAMKIQGLDNISQIYGNYGITKDNKVIDFTTINTNVGASIAHPEEIVGLENIIKISLGANHTVFLTKTGTAYAMGTNTNGQCGNGKRTDCLKPDVVKNSTGSARLENIKDIAAGDSFTIAVLENGEVYTWGSNKNNKLGSDQTSDQVLPKKVLNTEKGIIVSAGINHATYVNSEGRVYNWGNGENGTLGNSVNANSQSPVLVGSEEVIVNNNHLIIQKGGQSTLTAGLRSFNLIKELVAGDITFEANDKQVINVDEKTGVVTGVEEGTTSITVSQDGTDHISIVQVSVIKKGTQVKPSVNTLDSTQIILKSDGSVWTYGENKDGQLGVGSNISSDNLTQVEFDTDSEEKTVKICEIAVGEKHVVALDTDGNVWTWGANNNYQLGNNKITGSTKPVKVELDEKIVKIAAGYNSTFAITQDNRLIAWGLNTNGELGLGNYENKLLPTKVQSMKNVLDIRAGKSHAIAITTDGNVWTVGNNSFGSLGGTEYKRNTFKPVGDISNGSEENGNTSNQDVKFAYISAGEYHNLALTTNRKLYVWGYNVYGQLGTNSTDTINSPTQITNVSSIKEVSAGKTHSSVVTREGNVYVTGLNGLGQFGNGNTDNAKEFTIIDTLSEVYSAVSGNTYSMVIKKDGSVWAMGDYYHGTQDIRTSSNSNIPVQIGNESFYLRQTDISVNKNSTKQLDINKALTFNVYKDSSVDSTYRYFSLNEDILTVDSNGNITGIEVGTTWVKVIDTVTFEEQIAIIRVVEEENVVAPKVVGGKDYAAILKADGGIWSFGYNSNGELGNSTFASSNVPKEINILKSYKDISAGEDFTLILRNDGTVWSVGDNQFAQLGLGNRTSTKVPTLITSLENVIKISSGKRHSVALTKYGEVFTWGANESGQLGINSTDTKDRPVKISIPGTHIIDVSAGNNYTALVCSDGKVYVFGTIAGISSNIPVEISTITNAVKVATGEELIVLTKDGNVIKVGETSNTTIYSSKNAVDIVAKDENYMILNNNGELYVFGKNANGELGIGTVGASVDTPTKIENIGNVISIGSGTNNTYFINELGLVYSAGANTYGALGNETTEDSSIYTLVGKREFTINPDNVLMSQNDIVEFEIESERYNVLKEDSRKTTDFEWTSQDTNVMTVEDTAKIKGIAQGETKLIVTQNDTGFEKEITVVVEELDNQRIEELSVDDTDAKIVGLKKYEVTIATDNNTGKLHIKTKDNTDRIKINTDEDWTEGGTLDRQIDIPGKTTTVTITVRTENDTDFEYTLTIIKQSNVAELEHLFVNSLEATSISTTQYAMVLDEGVDTAQVHAITKSLDAKVSIDGLEAEVHESIKTISMEDKSIRTIPIKVIAESGKEIDYVLTIYKKSALTELQILTVDGKDAIQNEFNPLEYTIMIERDLEEVEVYAKTLLETAKVDLNDMGAEIHESTRKIKITGEDTIVKINVLAGAEEKEYTLTISKKPDTSGLAFVYVNGEKIEKNDKGIYETYIAANAENAEVLAISSVNTSTVQVADNPSGIGKVTVRVNTPDLENTYTITVTDTGDLEKTATYTLVIKKPSTDNTLKEIVIANNDMSVTATKVTGTNKYTAKINEKYTDMIVNAKANYEFAEVAIDTNSYSIKEDSLNINFTEDTYILKIKVKSQNGEEAEYELILERISSNTDLEYVKVDGNSAVLSETLIDTYEVTLTKKLTQADVNVRTLSEFAEVALNNVLYEVQEITKQIDMDSKDVTVKINVKAEDGTLKTYDLIIHSLPDNTKLTEIEVNGIKATVVPYTNKYQVRVPSVLLQYNVTVTTQDSLAKIKFTDLETSIERQGINTEVITKTENLTTVNIKITAQDEDATENYILEIIPMSSNVELSYVKVDGAIIDMSDDGEYHVKVVSATTQVIIEALTKDKLANVGIDKIGTSNLVIETKTLTGDTTIFNIIVTAEDGTTQSYKLNVEKMSNDTSLLHVYVEDTEIFEENGKYIAKIGNNTDVTVKGVTTNENALISVDKNEDVLHENSETISVTEEEKIVEITVTSEDGTIRTYNVKLVRNSSDNTLLSITADGIDNDKIVQTGETTYQMIVSNELTKVNLTATATKEVAKVKIGDNEYELGKTTKEISIPDDTNTVNITVQAENGEEKEYTLTIIKKYVLTLESIVVNGEIAILENGEYTSWISPTSTEANVVITPTSSKVNITVDGFGTTVGVKTFTVQTPEDETNIKIIVKSPVEEDQVEYVLNIAKKSTNTALEYVKVDSQVGVENEDEQISYDYVVKVPIKEENYKMEIKTESAYAKVKIEDNEYSTQIDTYEVDLSDVTYKDVRVTVMSQNGEEKVYTVKIEKVSDDATLKTVKVGDSIIEEQDGIYKAFIKDSLTEVPLYLETTHAGAKFKLNDDNTEYINKTTQTIKTESSQQTIEIVVTAEDGTTKNYSVIIAKESSDTGIQNVSVDNKNAVLKEEDIYYVTAIPGATEVEIKVIAANQYAFVQINGSQKKVKEDTIKFTLPTDKKIAEVPIIITAQNGTDTKTYTLQIEQVSNNTNIAKVQVNNVDVTEYNEETKTYTIIVDDTVDEANVFVETENEEASVKVEASDLSKHTVTETVSTASEENEITITVMAEDGTTETRKLIIKKLSRDATIIKLYVNDVEIEPEEDGTYIAELLESIKSASVRVKTTNAQAQIEIDGTLGTTKGDVTQEVNTSTLRQIVVPIKVTAEDTTIVNNTTLTINMVSDIKELEYVKVNSEQVTQYDEQTFTYKTFIPANSTSAVIEIKTKSPYANINIDSTEATNIINYTQAIEDDITYVYVDVIAENDSVRTYTIILQKISTDATLKELLKDGVHVSEEEDGNYIINVAESTKELTLKAIANNEYATIAIGKEEAEREYTQKKVTLDEEKTTTVNIIVTAQNGDQNTYTVTINKISASTELEYVKVNSEQITQYDEISKTYKAFIPTNSTSANVEIKSKSPYANLECGDILGTQTITLTQEIEADETTLAVTVTAENGDTEDYYIKLIKISSDNSLKEIYVDNKLIKPTILKPDDAEEGEEGEVVYIAEVLETKLDAQVKAIAGNEYATVKIDNNTAEIKETEKTIILGNNREVEVIITITSQSGDTREDKLIIRKITDITGINRVLVNEIECKEYDEETKTYTAYINEDINLSKILVTSSSTYATVVVGEVTGLGSAELTDIDTSEEKTRVEVSIKAQTGKIEKYHIDIIKKSSEASLQLVKVNDITINEPYTVKIKQTDTKAKIYVKASSNKARVQIADEDAEISEATATINTPLTENEFKIPVIVTAQDGTKETHYITLTRASSNTKIKEILVNGEVVDLNTFEHIVKNVNISNIKVTTEDETAKVAIDSGKEELNIVSASVNTDSTTVRTITVTAEDGTSKQYSLTLTKKITITGIITDENVMNKHLSTIIVYQSNDTRPEIEITDMNKLIASITKEDGTIDVGTSLDNQVSTKREIISIVQTNEDGSYEIILEPGNYEVLFKKPGYLSHRITEIDISQGNLVTLDIVQLLGGDVVETGKIEIDDMVDLSQNLNVVITEENKAEKGIFDLNGDGKIDTLDRNILKKNFGKREETHKWVNPNPPVVTDEEVKELSLENDTIMMKNNSEITSNNEFILPMSCEYKISSKYGTRIHPIEGKEKTHHGIDLVGIHHTEILSVADGVVTYAGVQNGYGNCIEIKHTIDGKTIYSFYAHLSKIDIKVGDRVKQAQAIGLEGGAATDNNPGTSTGHHLHFELRTSTGAKNSIDPNQYIKF